MHANLEATLATTIRTTEHKYMNTQNHHNDEERIDALDHLIFRELGRQQQMRQQMQQWDNRQRQRFRSRLLPVVSNAASVAALFVMGLVLQAMLPTTKVTTEVKTPIGLAIPDSTSVGTDSLHIQE